MSPLLPNLQYYVNMIVTISKSGITLGCRHDPTLQLALLFYIFTVRHIESSTLCEMLIHRHPSFRLLPNEG